MAGGSSCLTLARRRAGEAAPARRVADHSALLQACGVRRRSSEEAQQHVVVTQGREGADRQLHLGKGHAAHARSLPPRPGKRASSRPGPTQGTCPLVCSMAALLNVDPCPLESSLEPNPLLLNGTPLGHSWDRAWVCPGFSGYPRSKGTTQRMESLCPGPAPQPGPQPCVGPRPSPLTSPWAWRLMFCGWAPVTATQDSLRLHSQWPLSAARGHSAFLVQLQGWGAVLDWCPSAPGLGQGCTPRFWAGPRPCALTGPRRHTSRSRGPVSSGSECSWRSWHTPAREAGTPEGTRAASMTMASSQRGPPPDTDAWDHQLNPTFTR